MQSLRLLLRYLAVYKKAVWGNIFSNILMAVFTVVSIPAIIPLFQILFNQTEAEKIAEPDHFGADNILENLKFLFQEYAAQHDKQSVVLWICALLLMVFFLKNLFRYLSLYFMAIVRNGTVRDLRQQLYKKVLSLPISFFTEERKGDLISRMSGDVQEVEWSILNVLETVFREPVILVGSLAFMIYLSPSLTGLVFIVLIGAGVLIVAISKSLRRNSATAQERLGSMISTVEETLSGLKVIKSFNAEPFLYRAFSKLNNSYRDILTKLLRR
ncbi:MAG: ABC transporter transmembrane domain-containing protein, partial [Saprospiraceae bacterium]